MATSLFDTTADALPEVLPIFPLPQAVLLPGQPLPLNIFEPRYLAMVLDALGNGRLIGMIQPRRTEGGSDEGSGEGPTAVHAIGCAGRITTFQEAPGDRLVIQLTGVCRFRIAEELDEVSGYRRVRPDWTPFSADLGPAPQPLIGISELEPALRQYAEVHSLEIPWDGLGRIEPASLIDVLCTQMPFDPEEKQVLLEAPTVVERSQLLLSVLALPGGDASEGMRH